MNLEKVIAVRNTKTVYRDSDKAIKLFNENYSTADVLNEALNLARVEQTGLNVPKLHEVTKVEGKWAIVMDYIPGKTIEQRIEADPEHKDDYLARFVAIQLDIHAHKAPLLSMLTDKMHRKIGLSGLDATTRYELNTRLNGFPKHDKLCHGDYDPSNVIITPDDEAYVLDWAHATQGNASADAARTYLRFWLAGDISAADKYLKLFCQMSDTAKQYVESWLPIVASSQLVKGNPKEREFLLQWGSVVDYE